MRLLDIHSHILPAVDDGARDVETSISLLEMMKQQGITDVIATPHFDASSENLEEFTSIVGKSYGELQKAMADSDLPTVHTGCEFYYFAGIGRSRGIRSLTLCNSDYLLLELPNTAIDDRIIKDIKGLNDLIGVTPIIAHIERYYSERGFKKLLRLIEENEIQAQVNTASVLDSPYRHIAMKLIKKGYVSYLATDAHSVKSRPPLMDKALDAVEEKLGKSFKSKLVLNSDRLYDEIIGNSVFAAGTFYAK